MDSDERLLGWEKFDFLLEEMYGLSFFALLYFDISLSIEAILAINWETDILYSIIKSDLEKRNQALEELAKITKDFGYIVLEMSEILDVTSKKTS